MSPYIATKVFLEVSHTSRQKGVALQCISQEQDILKPFCMCITAPFGLISVPGVGEVDSIPTKFWYLQEVKSPNGVALTFQEEDGRIVK